jgi:hypothetical protein
MALKTGSMFLVIFCTLGISAQTNRNGRKPMERAATATPRRSSQSSEDEVRKAIVELDREYQEAVKNKYAKTVARILSDDFVLANRQRENVLKGRFAQ